MTLGNYQYSHSLSRLNGASVVAYLNGVAVWSTTVPSSSLSSYTFYIGAYPSPEPTIAPSALPSPEPTATGMI